VIRRSLRSHNDTPFGWPIPGRPIGWPGVGHPQGAFDVFGYYQLVMLFFNMVCLTVALAGRRGKDGGSRGPTCVLDLPLLHWMSYQSAPHPGHDLDVLVPLEHGLVADSLDSIQFKYIYFHFHQKIIHNCCTYNSRGRTKPKHLRLSSKRLFIFCWCFQLC
jgi:hypothetical protein